MGNIKHDNTHQVPPRSRSSRMRPAQAQKGSRSFHVLPIRWYKYYLFSASEIYK